MDFTEEVVNFVSSDNKTTEMKTAIIGGGAAGFFLAINLKERCPRMEVTIFERARKVLAKVEVSGGGRCNCTNTFDGVSDLQQVYPRGHRLMKRLFNIFGPADAYRWFEEHGVPLVAQTDGCVFPEAQDSHAIIGCFVELARRLGVRVLTEHPVNSLDELTDYDFVCVTVGGQPREKQFGWLAAAGHAIQTPVPSLYTFSVADERLRALMGTVVEHATASLPSTSFRADGPLLITHWGMSGPAILRLSSYAARYLSERNWQSPLSVNWLSLPDTDVSALLQDCIIRQPQKQLSTVRPHGLPARLWDYLLGKALGTSADRRWGMLGKKDCNRLVNVICNDSYAISGRGVFKEEFVTCGGIDLKSVNLSTLESRHVPHLFFAGEVLDVDGVTGGFNFQAAWTTAYVVAEQIAKGMRNKMRNEK